MTDLVLAYIDPGSGAVALQLLLAGVAGAAIVARALIRRLRELIFRRPTRRGPGQQHDQ